MSKTFNSAHAENSYQQLNIVEVDAGIRVSVDHNSHGAKGLIIAPSDAPALALAILEAAGVEAKSIPSARIGTSEHLSDTAYELSTYVEKQQRETAEAKEQAELEAEAFNLYRAYMAVHEPMNAIGDWQMLAGGTKQDWLAVARRAREINKEATNA